jgi:altronate dehydratase large subunit
MTLIRIHPSDNVAVALKPLSAGQKVDLPWGSGLTLIDDIPASHKVALADFKVDDPVIRYGQTIGLAAEATAKGSWLYSHNLREPKLKSAKAQGAGLPPQIEGLKAPDTFLGYTRPIGPAGTRNHLLILPTVACAVGVARAVGRAVPGATVVEHPYGCGRGGVDLERTLRVLLGCGRHPNVGAVLIIGLGCEILSGTFLLEPLKESKKPVEFVEIQKHGGSRKTTTMCIELAQKLLAQIKSQKRAPQPVADLMLGLQCGGSDALSGVTANPAVGRVSDWLSANGGTVILAETTELIGTQHLLQARAMTQDIADDIGRIIQKNRNISRTMLGENAHLAVAPGNMDGGLSTIMEKSLGCINKGGGGIINEVIEYGETPTKNGLVIMDTPGYDVESLGGLVAAGCQAIFFTTGRGTPVGAPLSPVIKVASNSTLAKSMADDMDLNAGLITDGKASLSQMGQILLTTLIEVAEGKPTCAEVNDQGILALSMTMEAL